jgi:hypothetical protein
LTQDKSEQPPSIVDDTEKREDLFFELAKRRYNEELERRRELDSKTGNLISHVTIITGVIIGLGTFSIAANISDLRQSIPYYSGISLLLGSIISSLTIAKARPYESTPSIDGLRELKADKERNNSAIIEALTEEMFDVVKINKRENDIKASRMNKSWWLLVAGLILLVGYTVVIGSQGMLVIPITNNTSTLQS